MNEPVKAEVRRNVLDAVVEAGVETNPGHVGAGTFAGAQDACASNATVRQQCNVAIQRTDLASGRRAEAVVGVGRIEQRSAHHGVVSSHVVVRAGVAADGHGTEAAGDTNVGATTEQQAALSRRTVVKVDTAFEVTDDSHAAADVFAEANAPARTVQAAGVNFGLAQAGNCGASSIELVGLVATDVCVEQTVDGHGRLSLCCTSHRAECGQSDKGLFH